MLTDGTKAQNTDMLNGNSLKKILLFSVPLIAGNIVIQLYSLVDAAIVGRFVGVNAFAAVGCTGWIVWLLGAVCRDSSNAICIMGAYQIGDGRPDNFKKTITTAVYFGLILTLVICIFMLSAMNAVLDMNSVPKEIYSEARAYLVIYTLGFPFIMICNMACAILRAAGNSRISFYAMTISAAVNIALDLLFVVGFGQGVRGAAWATFFAQGVSAVIAISGIFNQSMKTYRIQENDWKPDVGLCMQAIKLWLPMFWNTAIITAGGIYVQSCVNSAGAAFSAGFSAAIKIFNVFEAIVIAIQNSLSVFIGQNLGAKKMERIGKGFYETMLVTGLMMLLFAIVIWFFGTPLIDLFLSSENAILHQTAFTAAQKQLRYIMLGSVIMVPMFFFRAGVQALGHPNSILVAGIVQMAARILTVAALYPALGTISYHLTDQVAWAVSLPVVAIPFLYHYGRIKKNVA